MNDSMNAMQSAKPSETKNSDKPRKSTNPAKLSRSAIQGVLRRINQERQLNIAPDFIQYARNPELCALIKSTLDPSLRRELNRRDHFARGQLILIASNLIPSVNAELCSYFELLQLINSEFGQSVPDTESARQSANKRKRPRAQASGARSDKENIIPIESEGSGIKLKAPSRVKVMSKDQVRQPKEYKENTVYYDDRADEFFSRKLRNVKMFHSSCDKYRASTEATSSERMR